MPPGLSLDLSIPSVAVYAHGGGPVAPAAPTLTLLSAPSVNTPSFTLVGDLELADVVRFQRATDSGFATAVDSTNTITAPEQAAGELDFATGALADGAWWFRARTERGATISAWSNVVTETIATSTLKVGLVSFWEFEDAGSPPTSWVDRVVASGNDLTPNGTPHPSSASGIVGNAVSLIAADSQFLSHASNASLQVGGTDFSVAGWVLANSLNDGNAAISKAGGFANAEFAIVDTFTGAAHNFGFQVFDNGGATSHILAASNFGAIPGGTLCFVACTYTNSTNTMAISVNNGTPNTLMITGPVSSGTGLFEIGAADGVAFWDGKVDQAGLWKKVLSAGEITQLYNSGAGIAYAAM